jgi:hypothetical protein
MTKHEWVHREDWSNGLEVWGCSRCGYLLTMSQQQYKLPPPVDGVSPVELAAMRDKVPEDCDWTLTYVVQES